MALIGGELLFRDDEARLQTAAAGKPWSFDADGALLHPASEAQPMRLAHLTDLEARAYAQVTEDVCEEFSRAENSTQN